MITSTPPPFHSPLTVDLSKVSNRVVARLHPDSHIPVLDQARPNHPPDAGDVAHPERNAVAFEVDRTKGSTGQVGADEDALDLDRAAFEFGGLEGDYDRSAALCVGVDWVSACIFRISMGNSSN